MSHSNTGGGRAAKWAALSGAVGLFCLAIAASPEAVERLLTGESTGQLAWGPTLFRALLLLHALGLLWVGLTRDRIGERFVVDRPQDDQPAWGILALILLVALGLRLWRLNSQLWLDEIATVVNYTRRGPGHILSVYDSQNHHILYSFLAWASASVFGEQPWALRLPAVLFGVGAISLVYVLGRQVTSRTEAILAALLTAVLYHHLWFCQNARGYTGMLFFTLASSIFFVAGIRDGRRRTWILYAISASLGAWVHMTMVFVVAGHFVIYLAALCGIGMKRPAAPLRPLTGFVWAALLTLLLYSLVLPQVLGGVLSQDYHESSKVKEWKSPLWAIMEFVAALQIGFAVTAGAIGAVLLVGAGMVSYARRRSVLIGLLLAPVLIGGSAVLWTRHAIWPRFFYFSLGFGVLVVVRGAFSIGDFLHHRGIAPRKSGLFFCVVLIALSAGSVPMVYGPKQDYQNAIRYVDQEGGADDAVVVIGVASFCFAGYYGVDWVQAESLRELNQARRSARRTWVVYMFPLHLSTELPDLWNVVRTDFDVVKEFRGTLRGGEIYIARSRGKYSEET